MKQLRFYYEIQLNFSQEVRDHLFLVRCKPMENKRQHCGNYSFRILPEIPVDEVEDGFGNRGFSVMLRDAHNAVRVTSEGIVYVQDGGEEENCSPMYRFPTGRTYPSENIRTFLKETEQEAGHPLCSLEDCRFLMDRLYKQFSYVPGVTNVKTTAEEALRAGQGVCQDYAHIFISLVRLAGIPARYVAGMMKGEGASHAWAEVWFDGMWYGLDPTNDLMVDDTYIKLTHGRDFEDSTIDKGYFLGFAIQSQNIHVKVEEIL